MKSIAEVLAIPISPTTAAVVDHNAVQPQNRLCFGEGVWLRDLVGAPSLTANNKLKAFFGVVESNYEMQGVIIDNRSRQVERKY